MSHVEIRHSRKTTIDDKKRRSVLYNRGLRNLHVFQYLFVTVEHRGVLLSHIPP